MRPAQRSRISSNTGQEIASWGESEFEMRADRLRAVRIGAFEARIPSARRHRRPTRTVPGPRPRLEARRRTCRPGLGLRGQIWPLSRWVWQSMKAGSTIRPPMSGRPVPAPATQGVMAAIRPARTQRSKSPKPSLSKSPDSAASSVVKCRRTRARVKSELSELVAVARAISAPAKARFRASAAASDAISR